jgi:hypothetical protein
MRTASQFERFDAPRHFRASLRRSGRGREQRASSHWLTCPMTYCDATRIARRTDHPRSVRVSKSPARTIEAAFFLRYCLLIGTDVELTILWGVERIWGRESVRSSKFRLISRFNDR